MSNDFLFLKLQTTELIINLIGISVTYTVILLLIFSKIFSSLIEFSISILTLKSQKKR